MLRIFHDLHAIVGAEMKFLHEHADDFGNQRFAFGGAVQCEIACGANRRGHDDRTDFDGVFTAAIPAQTAAETAGGSAVSPNSIDAAGGVQSGHTAGRAMAYRGIRAATAQMAGRQSFRNTGDVGLSCASRRAGRGPRPANTAGIVGIVRIASMQLTLARRAIAR